MNVRYFSLSKKSAKYLHVVCQKRNDLEQHMQKSTTQKSLY